MRVISKIFALILIAALSFSLASCGKISRPEPIEGSGYPHSYPRK